MSASGLKRLSERRNPFLAFATAANVGVSRTGLEQGLSYSDGSRRAPFDAAMNFKVLVIQAANNRTVQSTRRQSGIWRKDRPRTWSRYSLGVRPVSFLKNTLRYSGCSMPSASLI